MYLKEEKLRFYLDENICGKLDIPYYTSRESKVPHTESELYNVHIGEILLARSEWDDHHRSVMAGFIRAGRYVMRFENQGYGWFHITNYPTFINPNEEDEI